MRIQKAIKDDKEEEGSYGTEKAKYFSSAFFNNLCSIMEKKDSTLILISQVRENIGVTFGKRHYRTGGKALDFYTHICLWLYEKEKLKKEFRAQKRVYGIRVIGRFERNKVAKPFREAEFVILFDYGLDDIGSMLNYLYGPKEKSIIYDNESITKKQLLKMIEEDTDNVLYNRLIDEVEKDWNEIESAIVPKRKKRFGL